MFITTRTFRGYLATPYLNSLIPVERLNGLYWVAEVVPEIVRFWWLWLYCGLFGTLPFQNKQRLTRAFKKSETDISSEY